MIERAKERFQLTKTERMEIDPQRDGQKKTENFINCLWINRIPSMQNADRFKK